MGYSVFPAASSAAALPEIKQTFNTTSNSVSLPAGTNLVYALVIGGGGGGGANNTLQGVGGTGGNGGVTFGYVPAHSVATVGAAGTGSNANSSSNNAGASGGTAGGQSSYSLLVANGGGAGGGCPSPGQVSLGSPYPVAAGTAGTPTRTTTNISITGFNGGTGLGGTYNQNGNSGSVTLLY